MFEKHLHTSFTKTITQTIFTCRDKSGEEKRGEGEDAHADFCPLLCTFVYFATWDPRRGKGAVATSKLENPRKTEQKQR